MQINVYFYDTKKLLAFENPPNGNDKIRGIYAMLAWTVPPLSYSLKAREGLVAFNTSHRADVAWPGYKPEALTHQLVTTIVWFR